MQYRTEHPKPQFMRGGWRNLNGEWEFEIDRGNSGEARGMHKPGAPGYNMKINVPFCPQSRLSGVADTDFMNSVWYRRTFDVSTAELGGRIKLHFGAVDYRAAVYINGEKAGEHKGGYVSFAFDITEYVREGENTLVVHAEDDERDPRVPRGKQSELYFSHGCDYTRTTGIWQTVWLEFMPETHIEKVRYYPDLKAGAVTVWAELCGKADFSVETSFGGKATGGAALENACGQVTVTVPLSEKHPWEIGKGGLYDLTLAFGDDRVKSYFGLRSAEFRDGKFLLNGKSVFQRLVLDQGFYPDGIYTAPSDAELEGDIDRSTAMGFNGARLHEKVFEERFLYHCDRKGYIVWGEYPNWGLDVTRPEAVYTMLPEWIEEIERDRNHPAIIGWCPFNETSDRQYDPLIELVYRTTKAADPTRPCIDTSGWVHVVTDDVYDVHDYEQFPDKFASHFANLKNGECVEVKSKRQSYKAGLPLFVSEYGGIGCGWLAGEHSWGYGNLPKNEEEFLLRLKGTNDALLDNPLICAMCYTQLTDVEQEQNGLYTYDRKPKIDPAKIAPLFARPAAIER